MDITTESLEHRQLRMIIEVDEERTRQAMQQAARQIAKKVNIPGFRKGRAPYDLIVQRFGEDAIRQEAAEALVDVVYREAVEQKGIVPYAAPVLNEATLRPLTFTFTVPLLPTVDLANYRTYRLKPPKVKVDKKQVKEALEAIRQEHAILESVERPAALGDGIVVDVTGRTPDGNVFLKEDDAHLLLETDKIAIAAGFAEALVGMSAGEARTFKVTLSDRFAIEELRGEEAEFTVRMKEVYKSTLPPLDDDLARAVGNFDSIKALRKHVEEQLQQAAQRKADDEYAERVLTAILEQARVEYPPVMLEQELDRVVEEFSRAVKEQTRLTLEDYMRLQHKDMDELREELRPQAEARLKRDLVLAEVTKVERLEAGAEEVEAEIEQASAVWGIRADEIRTMLRSDAGRRAVRSRLLMNKAVQRLVAIARGEAPPLPPTAESETQGIGGQEQ